MGTVINLYLIPRRISPEEWRGVYQESLRLIEECNFLDRIETRRNGLRYNFARKTKDREGFPGQGGHGWLAAGDLRTGEGTEDFMLPEDICVYLPKEETVDNGEEILLSTLDGMEGIRKPPGCANIWGGQTWGGDGHIYLLAIACLIVSRFPGASMVFGDISAGQCRKAVRWANGYLEKPVELPDTVRMDRLLKRLRNSSLPERNLLEAFYQLTEEPKGAQMGEFLRKEFAGEELYGFYRRRFGAYRIHQRGFTRIMKEYLEMGFGFQGLCWLAVSDPEGTGAEPKEFLKRILESKLHVKEKEIYDFAGKTGEKGDCEEDTDDEFSARFFSLLTGVGNRNVDAFYPLDKIREDCKMVFGERCQVDSLMDQLVACEKEIVSGRDSLQAILCANPGAVSGQEQTGLLKERETGREEGGYDVNSYRELAGFVPGCRVKPELEEDLVGNFRAIHQYTEETFEEFQAFKKEERENCLIQESDGLLLREEVWERIFDRIMDDGYIERIYGILSVNRDKKDGELFCRSLFSSLQTIDCYWEKTKR